MTAQYRIIFFRGNRQTLVSFQPLDLKVSDSDTLRGIVSYAAASILTFDTAVIERTDAEGYVSDHRSVTPDNADRVGAVIFDAVR
jgi:hypothetical protein